VWWLLKRFSNFQSKLGNLANCSPPRLQPRGAKFKKALERGWLLEARLLLPQTSTTVAAAKFFTYKQNRPIEIDMSTRLMVRLAEEREAIKARNKRLGKKTYRRRSPEERLRDLCKERRLRRQANPEIYEMERLMRLEKFLASGVKVEIPNPPPKPEPKKIKTMTSKEACELLRCNELQLQDMVERRWAEWIEVDGERLLSRNRIEKIWRGEVKNRVFRKP
jgi:hypothetical protein